MIGGISLGGVLTASLASWIVQRVAETDIANRAATAAQIDDVRNGLRSLAEQVRQHRRQHGELRHAASDQ